MTQLPTRIACFSLVFASGLSLGCGSDEAIFSVPEPTPDSGDGTDTTTPSNVEPTPSTDDTSSVEPTPMGPATSSLAARCSTNAHCGTGMVCKTAADDDFQGGGPGNGYCTVDCTSAVDDSFCEEFEAGAICLPTSDTQAHCMPSCAEGIDPGGKCQGRADVLCDFITYSDYGISYCSPACGSDADCDGKRCHLGLGTCVDELEGQDPVGSACDPDAQINTCASGACVRGATPGTQDTGFCTGICTVGAVGCGETEDEPDDPGAAFCANVVGRDSGVGDLGLCFQRCSCDDHCLSPDFKCLSLPDAAANALGASGLCIEYDTELADPSLVVGVECPAAPDGGGATSEAGTDASTDAGGSDAAMTDAMFTPMDASDAAQPDGALTDGALMSEPDAADAN